MQPLPLPAGVRNVNPYLLVEDPAALVPFLTEVFGGVVDECLTFEGKTGHVQMRIGDATVMIGSSRGWTAAPAMLYVYVDDCDATYARAIAAGAEPVMEPADMYYGDRHGGVRDSAGNTWWIATHVEEVAPEELQRRHEAAQRARAPAP
jgi:PhnB protein